MKYFLQYFTGLFFFAGFLITAMPAAYALSPFAACIVEKQFNADPKIQALKIGQYDYDGKTVYLVKTAEDNSSLLDEKCAVICEPGESATQTKADKKCPDFFKKAVLLGAVEQGPPVTKEEEKQNEKIPATDDKTTKPETPTDTPAPAPPVTDK
ncbi:MAG: hypothetical protein JWM96_1270 [Alphaproteobacteria bacterium]|nr:hypothetical protein [Alphaproteobacteria bacterium]